MVNTPPHRGSTRMKRSPLAILVLVAMGAAATVSAEDPAPPPYAVAAIASADRPPADVARDGSRKPGALVTFATPKPSDQIADIMPGGGYFTRTFSHVVGPGGHVYAMIPAELAQVGPKAVDGAKALAGEPSFSNVTVLVQPTAALATPQPLDVAWTSDNYHDLYGFFGANQPACFDVAVFKMLKPVGVSIAIDHAAAAGAGGDRAKTLHRIDPAIVKAQVLAAGFIPQAESSILANPDDPHSAAVFSPAIRRHTDQFVLRFRKPKS